MLDSSVAKKDGTANFDVKDSQSSSETEAVHLINDAEKGTQENDTYKSKASEDVNDLIDEIDEILVDNATVLSTRNPYKVEAEAISDEEFELGEESEKEYRVDNVLTDTRGNAFQLHESTSKTVSDTQAEQLNLHVFADYMHHTLVHLNNLSTESANDQIQSGTKSENKENCKLLESKAGQFTNDIRNDTAKKTYIECMEIEDISPPLSNDSQTFRDTYGTNVASTNTDSDELVSNFGQYASLTNKEDSVSRGKVSISDSESKTVKVDVLDAVHSNQPCELGNMDCNKEIEEQMAIEKLSSPELDTRQTVNIGAPSRREGQTQSGHLSQFSEDTVNETETLEPLVETVAERSALSHSGLSQRSSPETGLYYYMTFCTKEWMLFSTLLSLS